MLGILVEVLTLEASERLDGGELRVLGDSNRGDLLDLLREILVFELVLELVVGLADVSIEVGLRWLKSFQGMGKVAVLVNCEGGSLQVVLELNELGLKLVVGVAEETKLGNLELCSVEGAVVAVGSALLPEEHSAAVSHTVNRVLRGA